MSGEFIAFFVLSVMAIGGAVFMINMQRVMHMALALAFTFFSIAGIYLLLNAPFLAVIQVLIYTGAISILMLFGIMLTKHRYEEKSAVARWQGVIGFIGVACFLGVLMWTIYRTPLLSGQGNPKDFGIHQLGAAVFKEYAIPFEVASILLLVALVGAVILAKREENECS
ncbi:MULTISPECIES: NADH-quinone oxidoreductase subunit J [Thermoactinomyces]|uniref:NADH-quinone oxidoreductase subunit J n=1 Tax=Thermoactinomyces daqus TaxID=1329516 RepID=A0A7W2AG42_9BACL|nr:MULTISPECIES: NADH-quinone oxidoreductase subunit J [Thermoactinomyces]MBA4541827.1 NADH-quinone oxidoreductase subunit J [Thermoactinomyces daqus]MBH8597824.1 NADH-quinone oxidoreductase subunit J [Thermoactinomyces sp. CICC 10523]MBH8604175.1 NADH-quinone oxidoreductase subunit J [Thermoactinomyces sp. CICC 10522]MBH8608103.1 NADH-quinone oxidoreductase subunit J [Thermoactinomyces sp. CICC 10521]